MESHYILSAKSFVFKSAICLFCLITISSGHAQQVTPFVKGGLGLSDWKLSDPSDPNTGLLPALHLGIFAEAEVHPSFYLQSGIQFSTMGAQVKFSESNSPKFSMGYFNIPVFGKLQLTDLLSVYAGPKVGFLLGAKEKESDGYKRDVRNSFKNNDFSMEGGFNYLLPVGMEIGIYFTHGLINVYDAGDTKIRNCSMGVNARYNIPLDNG